MIRLRVPAPPPGSWLLLLSGLLLGLAHPPFHLLFPSFIALVPFGVWLTRLPRGLEGRRAALRGGMLLGLVYFSIVFYWLIVALVFYTRLAILAFLAPVMIMAGMLALATLGMKRAMDRLRWPVWLALPVFWTTAEWLRAHLGAVSFPWMGLGDTLTDFPWLVGAADVVGSRGISFWLALANGLFAALIVRRMGASRGGMPASTAGPSFGRQSGRAGLLVGSAACLALPIGYSLLRWSTLQTRPVGNVAVVQPNIPEDLKLEREAAVVAAVRSTDRLLKERLQSHAGSVDLLVLPETALPVFLYPLRSENYEGRPELRRWIASLSRHLDAPVLFGAIGSSELPGGGYDYFNSAFLVDRAGKRVGTYDKRYLVPIVERVPFLDPKWFGKLHYFGGFGVGASTPPLQVGGARVGVLICYESIFAQLARRHRHEGADYFANLTNDAWYGRRSPWWSRSSALWQHPAHLVMRAIENRVGVVRSANTGISEIVDPRGRTHHRTQLFVPAAFVGEVRTTDGLTLYTRFGDVVGWMAALVAVLVTAWGVRDRAPGG